MTGKKWEIFFLVLLLALAFSLSTYKLTESPPTWFDEGYIIQSALNLVESGKMEIQIAPNKIVRSSELFSTGYPVTYPVGIVMKFFGRGLLQARAVMVLFLMLFVLFFYLFARKVWDFKTAILSSLLLASFAPLYGNGKNVLGEVPGLFFLVLFLFFINKLEKSDFKSYFYYAMAGLTAGLCVSTKPFFLILLPALLLTPLIFKRIVILKLKPMLLAALFFSFPLALWFKTQFSGSNSIPMILSDYSNPYAFSNVWPVIVKNALRFLTEATPIYFLALLIIWSVSIILKLKARKQKIILAEAVSFIFVILVWLAYFRTPGWYRYLFPAHVLMLLYFPAAFYVVFNFIGNLRIYKLAAPLLLSALISIQFYQVGFSSWVATYYHSTRAKDLADYFNKQDSSKSIFIYRNPEIAVFLQHNNYYQYLKLLDTLEMGADELNKINLGVPDEVVMTIDGAEEANKRTPGLFLNYKEKTRVNRYLIFERK